MTLKMTTNGTLSYPVFKANQVLTDAHLNAAVSYLEAQTLLTRATLIGTGIVCGLEPGRQTSGSRPALTISRGCGVTSDGYLITVEVPCVLAYYRHVLEVGAALSDFPGVDGFQHPVYELFGTDTHQDDPENPTRPLNEALPGDDAPPLWEVLPSMVVVLWLDIEDEDRDTCLFDCDEAGAQRLFTLRTLVMDRRDAARTVRAGFDCAGVFAGVTDFDAVFNRNYYLPELSLKRFGYTRQGRDEGEATAAIDLERITSLTAYLTAYEQVCGASQEQRNLLFQAIAEAYQRADQLFSPFFTAQHPNSNADFASLEKTLLERFSMLRRIDASEEQQHGLQYFYDYLKDLILAYEELRAAAFDLMDDCLPSCDRYPRHLMLGQVVASASCPPSIYRTPFTQPPIYNDNARRLQAVRVLYERMTSLAASFQLPEKADVKITPSRLAPAPLGTRAIPFYYDPKVLYTAWDFERTRRCKAWQTPSYHPLPSPEKTRENPLLCTIDAYDFYRIEGHVGQEYTKALQAVQALRRQYNLAFDLVALKIGIIADSDNIQYDFVFEDLETFYAKCKEELLCVLADLEKEKPPAPIAAQIKTLTEGLRTHPGSPKEIPDDKEAPQDEFLYGDYFDLIRLSQEGHFQEFSKVHTEIFTWARTGDLSRPYFDCTPARVKPLLDAYAERVSEIRQQLLFHNFVKTHPGVEHLAGVPRGGTFILVYVNEGEEEAVRAVLRETERRALEKASDPTTRAAALLKGDVEDAVRKALLRFQEAAKAGVDAVKTRSDAAAKALEEAKAALAAVRGREEAVASIEELLAAEVAARTNVVVGDFCLPYLCCAKAPSFSLVVAHPRPIVLLEEVSYCAGDPGPYPFILHPPNGLLQGPGVDSSSGFYEFIPNHPEVQERLGDGPTQITFTYWADGAMDTLTVEILPPRDATFTGLKPVYCIDPGNPDHPDNQRVALQRQTPGGTFTPDGPPLEEEAGNVFFNPTAAPLGTPVAITYTVPDGDDGCANASTQTVTVFTVLDAGFTFGEDDIVDFCVTEEGNTAPVRLIPVVSDPNAESVFAGKGVSRVNDGFVFDPAQIPVREGAQIVRVAHTIIQKDIGCENTLERTVTVRPPADARFEGPGADLYCVNLDIPEEPGVSPAPEALKPIEEGGTFRLRYTLAGQTRTVVLEDTSAETVAAEIIKVGQQLTAEEGSVPVTIGHEVGTPETCGATATVTFTVVLMPDAGFTGPGSDTFCLVFDEAGNIDVTPKAEALVPTLEKGSFRVTYTVFGQTRTEPLDAVDADAMNAKIREIAINLLESQQESLTVTILHTVSVEGVDGCSSTAEATVTILRLQVSFDPGTPRLTPDGDAFTVPVRGIQPPGLDRLDFTWRSDLQPNPKPVDFDGNQLRFVLADVGEARVIFVTLVGTRGACTSDPFTVSVQVPREPGGGGLSVERPDLGPEAIAVLNRRTAGYREQLTALTEEDRTLESTRSFALASSFVGLDASTPAAEVAEQYDTVLATLLPVFQRATDARKPVFESLVTAVTQSLFDRMVASAPKDVDVLSGQLGRLADAGVNVRALATLWKTDDLRTVLPAEDVDGYLNVLRRV